jgi:hypothetical protein
MGTARPFSQVFLLLALDRCPGLSRNGMCVIEYGREGYVSRTTHRRLELTLALKPL